MKRIGIAIGSLLIAGMAGCAALGDFASDDPGFSREPGDFVGNFLAVSDADMAATAYADGKLEPFEGAVDQITLFRDGQPVATANAPNSVISWPQIIDVTDNGRRAYVIETRGSLGTDVEAVENAYTDFPEGRSLRAYSIEAGNLEQIGMIDDVGRNPQSVEVSSNGAFLLVGTESDGAELAIVPLSEAGEPGAPRVFDLDPPYKSDDAEPRIRTLHLSPDGTTIAANVGNARVQFYSLATGTDGLPEAVEALGPPIEFGVALAVGRWTPDGRFFLITDVNSYDSTIAMLTQRGGQVHVVKPPMGDTSARLVASSRVGRFAEGLELSDDGALVASIAMERTYLPELFFLEAWPRRRTYLLTLLSLDAETGALTELDRIRAAGVLPEDVIFDATGRNLAVAVFHRRKGADRERGFIDFFSITESGELQAQGRTQAVMRGPHDLVRLPQ